MRSEVHRKIKSRLSEIMRLEEENAKKQATEDEFVVMDDDEFIERILNKDEEEQASNIGTQEEHKEEAEDSDISIDVEKKPKIRKPKGGKMLMSALDKILDTDKNSTGEDS